jgi:glutathione S-transferase
MITLYGFSPAGELPDTSPFVTKVDCYLRMAKVPYRLVSWQSFDAQLNAPKGKLPYIEDNGNRIADSGAIIEYIQQAYGDPLGDLTLSAREQAVAHGLRRLLEEHLYWVFCYARWLEDEELAIIAPVALAAVTRSSEECQAVALQVQGTMRTALHAQGLGRHSREEIYQRGQADLVALSEYLADNPYFMDDRPTALDASAYGLLAQVLGLYSASPLKASLQRHPNLVAFCQRIRASYYATNSA